MLRVRHIYIVFSFNVDSPLVNSNKVEKMQLLLEELEIIKQNT